MGKIWLCVAAFAGLFGSAVMAQDIFGPAAVANLNFDACPMFPEDQALFACLRANGVSSEALAFAQRLKLDPQTQMFGLMTRFIEIGQVDIAEVFFPGMANTNDQMLLVNGTKGVVSPMDWGSWTPGGDPGTMALLARYPQASPSGRLYIAAHRRLADGTQRFVITDILTDQCRACEIVGTKLSFMDFRAGEVAQYRELGWVGSTDPAGETDAGLARLLGQGSTLDLQVQLNLRGYDAGGMDGVAGASTRRALAEFQADHCLPQQGFISPQAVAILSRIAPHYAQPPCAGQNPVAALRSLPLQSGTYALDPRLCPPIDPDIAVAFGDRAYGMVVGIEGSTVSWGENICNIEDMVQRGAEVDLALSCRSEGTTQDITLSFAPITQTAFIRNGGVFHRCGSVFAAP